MKINNITASDYRAHDGLLELVGLTETTLEQITGMDTRVVEVRTDDGDLVEALAGYALRSVTFDIGAGAYTAVLALGTEDTTAATLSKLAGDLEAAQGQVAALQEANATLTEQMAAISGAIERGLSL